MQSANELSSASKNTRVLILCGGSGKRWKKHLGGSKHSIPIDGEPLINVMMNMVQAAGIDDIFILGRKTEPFQGPFSFVDLDEKFGFDIPNKFLSGRDFWNEHGPTVILFGDVWMSKTAQREILCNMGDNMRFVGRLSESKFTGCPYGEIFAFIFQPHHHGILEHHIKESAGKKFQGWDLYNRLSGRCDETGSNDVAFVHIDDMSEDFDFPKDYTNWKTAWSKSPLIAKRLPTQARDVARKWKRRAWIILFSGSIVSFWMGILALYLFQKI